MSSEFNAEYIEEPTHWDYDTEPFKFDNEPVSKSKESKEEKQPTTMAEILTHPEVIQFCKNLLFIGKHESLKLRANASNRLVSAKAKIPPAKALLKKRSADAIKTSTESIKSFVDNLPVKIKVKKSDKPSETNWDEFDKPTLARKLGGAGFEEWQHLNNVIETIVTPTLTKAHGLKFSKL